MNARSHYLNSSSILSAFQNLLEILSTETCHYVKHESKGTDDDKIKIAIVCPKNRYIKGAAVSCCSFATCFKCNASFIFPFPGTQSSRNFRCCRSVFQTCISLSVAKSSSGSFICEPHGPFHSAVSETHTPLVSSSPWGWKMSSSPNLGS